MFSVIFLSDEANKFFIKFKKALLGVLNSYVQKRKSPVSVEKHGSKWTVTRTKTCSSHANPTT